MKKIKTTAFIAVFVLIITSVLSACQSNMQSESAQQTFQVAVNQTLTAFPTATPLPTATSTPLPTATATPVAVQYGPTNFPDNVDPLTGLTVADPSILNRRPVMIKVSNYPRSTRPHAGLSFADIVFDYYIGEGGNRFLALYYGQDSTQVGPIRSGRLVDRWLVRMYQGILGLEYAYAPVYSSIADQLGASRMVSGTDNTCPAICANNDPVPENRWYANTAEMTKRYAANPNASNAKPNLDGMAFNTVPPTGGKDGHEFTMQFSWANLGQWKYDTTTKKYLRWIESNDDPNSVALEPLTDRVTGKQLAFSNVIVIFTHYETLNGDDTLHEITTAGGKGKILLFRDGQVYEGTWKAASYDAPIQFFGSDGSPLELQPGNTWISITGEYSETKEEETGVWRVIFHKLNN